MAILNYTTSISPEKTIMEIQKILSKYQAKSIMIDYNDGNPTGLTFMIYINDYPINYRLPSNYNGVFKILKNSGIAKRLKTEEQALKVSWRIVKDWLAAQMAIIDSGQAELPEILLPYAVTNTGETFYNRFKENSQKLLES